MAVALLLILLLLNLNSTHALEKDIKANFHRLKHPQKVYGLYKIINFRCLWFCEGKWTYRFHIFERLLHEAFYHGLNPEDYMPANGVHPEISVTDNLIKLSYHLYYGRVNPSKLYEGLSLPEKPDIVLEVLYRLIVEDRLEELYKELSPRRPDYWSLLEAGKALSELSHFEWDAIKLSKPLMFGDRSPCLERIAFRLFLLGDLKEYTPSDLFDEKILEAVKSFQRRHGLPETGIIDKRTLQELNVSPSERLKTIHINLERHRWLPMEIKKAVMVNVPFFELSLVREGKEVLSSKVVVGRNYIQDFRPTPMLYSKIESITINPKWYVPTSISVKDILPKVKKNPEYLTKKGFKVYSDGVEVNPLEIDWSLYNEKNFSLRLVQEAGPKNSLGRLKFNFPNPFAVYLHDTPEKHLFKHSKRAFSSGCIRVERAKELAVTLLGNGWNFKKLNGLIAKGGTQTIPLREKMPVYLVYFTALEREGKLHFREDLYGYDKILTRAIFSAGGVK